MLPANRDDTLYTASRFTDRIESLPKSQIALQPQETMSGGSYGFVSYHSHSHMLMMLHACHQHCHTARARYHIPMTNANWYQDNAIWKVLLKVLRALKPSFG